MNGITLESVSVRVVFRTQLERFFYVRTARRTAWHLNARRCMAKRNFDGKDQLVLAGTGFVLGLLTGLFVKGVVKQFHDSQDDHLWHRDYERTVTYDENLPES